MAIDDELGMLAHPRGIIPARPENAMLAAIAELARAEDVGRFVVGLPLDMKGGEGEAARKARRLAQAIADATGLPVELWDERLSTVQARRALAEAGVPERARGKRSRSAKTHIDEAAAATILQAWLERRSAP